MINRRVLTVTSPRLINLGAGQKHLAGYINVDILADTRPDVVVDLNRFPYPFGEGEFDQIACYDVLEHLDDLVRVMEEIHRIAKPGAFVTITVPHYSCSNSYTDPTHRHHLGYRSFDFFTGEGGFAQYTKVRFAYRSRKIIFYPTRKNTLVRRLANRWPDVYERHLAWILPAWFLAIELRVSE